MDINELSPSEKRRAGIFSHCKDCGIELEGNYRKIGRCRECQGRMVKERMATARAARVANQEDGGDDVKRGEILQTFRGVFRDIGGKFRLKKLALGKLDDREAKALIDFMAAWARFEPKDSQSVEKNLRFGRRKIILPEKDGGEEVIDG